MTKNTHIQKLLAAYKPLQPVYSSYAKAVAHRMEQLLKKHGFKFQIIKKRVKAFDSLKNKLENAKGFNPSRLKNIYAMQDLAGCRVVFYIDSDMKRFVKHIYDEFEINRHYNRLTKNSYNGVFVMVRPKKGTKLFSFKKFRNLTCEVQLTTILHDAWAELGHDIAYKPPKDLASFDSESLKALQEEFEKVMNDHIKPAGLSFEYIYHQVNKIRQGQNAFSPQFLKEIATSTSLTAIHQNLKVLHRYAREFGDKAPEEQSIIELAKTIIEKTKGLKEQPTETSFGKIRGSTREETVLEILDILSLIRYGHPEEIFPLLIYIAGTDTDAIKNKAVSILGKMAEYNLPVLKKVNFGAQGFIIEEMKKWSPKDLMDNFDAVIEISKKLLETDYEGHSWKGPTMTLTRGTLNGTPALKKIRTETIGFLKQLFVSTTEFEKRRKLIGALYQAFQPPQNQSNSGLDAILKEDQNNIFGFYREQLASMDNELIQDIDEQRNYLCRRNGGAVPPGPAQKVDELIARDESYQMFRVFVGYDGRISPNFDYVTDRENRSKKIEEYVRETTSKTLNQWLKNIAAVLKNYRNVSDPGEYSNVGEYLQKLGQRKPLLALRFLQDEHIIEPFLGYLIPGIWLSKKKSLAKQVMRTWIKQGKFLPTCAAIFAVVKEIDITILKAILKAAKTPIDFRAIIGAIAENYETSNKKEELRAIFLQAISELTTLKHTGWVNNIWHKKKLITADLTTAEADIVLNNLVSAPNIDYHTEQILVPLAEKYPEKIIAFFHQRVALQATKKREDKDRYDAIPYELDKIAAPLRSAKKVIIPALLDWYEHKNENQAWLFKWEASHLLSSIFPAFDSELEDSLVASLDPKKSNDLSKVFALLRNYEGQSFVWGLCKKIIEKYHKHSKYVEIKSHLWGYLSQTGVVNGEYGFAEAYEAKIKDSESWQTDNKPYLIEFLKGYRKHLQERADIARKEGDEQTFFRDKGVFD